MELGDPGTDRIRDHAVVLSDSQKGSTEEPEAQIHHCKPDGCSQMGRAMVQSVQGGESMIPVLLLAITLAGAGLAETETETFETETEMSREIDSDLFNVAHLMMAEAGYTDSTERRLTASVLLNRVDSDLFPDTIGECLYQPGQYSTVRSGGPFWWEPTEDCWKDAEELLTQWYETGDTDLPENVLYQSRGPLGSGTYLISGWGQYFCYQ